MLSSTLWSRFDELSIFQAALLVLGYDPKDEKSCYIHNSKHLPDGYHQMKELLVSAVVSDKIEGKKEFQQDGYQDYLDIDETKIDVVSLKNYLKLKNIKSDFFFENEDISVPDYLNKEHANFSVKLNAAIMAWQAVSNDPHKLNGQTAKQAVKGYLEENAHELGLIKRDGSINSEAIKEISKVCNWNIGGGAPKTKTHMKVKSNLPTPKEKSFELKELSDVKIQKFNQKADFDDEIPF